MVWGNESWTQLFWWGILLSVDNDMDDLCRHVTEGLFSGRRTLCTCLHQGTAGEASLDVAEQFQHQHQHSWRIHGAEQSTATGSRDVLGGFRWVTLQNPSCRRLRAFVQLSLVSSNPNMLVCMSLRFRYSARQDWGRILKVDIRRTNICPVNISCLLFYRLFTYASTDKW